MTVICLKKNWRGVLELGGLEGGDARVRHDSELVDESELGSA